MFKHFRREAAGGAHQLKNTKNEKIDLLHPHSPRRCRRDIVIGTQDSYADSPCLRLLSSSSREGERSARVLLTLEKLLRRALEISLVYR